MKTYTILILLSIIFMDALAQTEQYRVTGQIIDKENGEPLIGVIVGVKNTSNRVYTDIDGIYRLDSVSIDAILVFNYVGYKSVEIPVDGRSTLDIRLEEDYQDWGLPSVYYIRSDVHGGAYATLLDGKAGCAFDVSCTLPYTASERYGTSLYDKIKSHVGIGVKVAKIRPGSDNIKGSLYLRGNLSKWLGFKIKNVMGFSPYVTAGLYIDADKRMINSQNFEYGGGLGFSPYVRWIPYWISFNVGYQGFIRQPSDNNFYMGIRILAAKRPMIYY